MRMTFVRLGPRMATAVTATIRYGNARNPSVMLISTRSIQPFRKPDSTAMSVPTTPATKTDKIPTATEIRAP